MNKIQVRLETYTEEGKRVWKLVEIIRPFSGDIIETLGSKFLTERVFISSGNRATRAFVTRWNRHDKPKINWENEGWEFIDED